MSAASRKRLSRSKRKAYRENPEHRQRLREGQRKRRAKELQERTPPQIEEKPCSKCEEVKPLEDFPHRKHKLKSGFISIRPDSWCKECYRLKAAANYQQIKDEGRLQEREEQRLKWQQRNRSRYLQRERERGAMRRRKEGAAPRKLKKPHISPGKQLPVGPAAEFFGRVVEERGGYPACLSHNEKRRLLDIISAVYPTTHEDLIDRFLLAFDAPDQFNVLYPPDEPNEPLVGYHLIPA